MKLYDTICKFGRDSSSLKWGKKEDVKFSGRQTAVKVSIAAVCMLE